MSLIGSITDGGPEWYVPVGRRWAGRLQGGGCFHLPPGSDLGRRDPKLQGWLDYGIGGGSNLLGLGRGNRNPQDH
ncbi:MAG: hypothetical protein ABIG94_05625 [Pseudomonadota bacterium]